MEEMLSSEPVNVATKYNKNSNYPCFYLLYYLITYTQNHTSFFLCEHLVQTKYFDSANSLTFRLYCKISFWSSLSAFVFRNTFHNTVILQFTALNDQHMALAFFHQNLETVSTGQRGTIQLPFHKSVGQAVNQNTEFYFITFT